MEIFFDYNHLKQRKDYEQNYPSLNQNDLYSEVNNGFLDVNTKGTLDEFNMRMFNNMEGENGKKGVKNKLNVKNKIEEETTSSIPLHKQYLYKTEFCRSWMESKTCKYGDKCQFAHGLKELRHLNRHPKYKTEICKSFHEDGTCPFGTRCRFVHFSNDEKLEKIKEDTQFKPIDNYSYNVTSNGSKLPFFRKLRTRQSKN